MPEFNTPADIGNLALQFCGQPPMSAALGFNDTNARARAVSAVYGKLRRAELRRAPFKFANRNTVMRPMDTNTRILAPTVWSSAITYFLGSVVADSNGTLWASRIPNNSGSSNQPGVNFAAWAPYFGPLSVMLYNSTTLYFAGEIVYTAPGDGTYNVYQSLVSNNGFDPSLPNQWAATQMYQFNWVVEGFPNWSSLTTYSAGQTVVHTDGNTYSSLVGSNLNNIPANTINSKWALMPILQISPSTTLATPAVSQPQGTLPQMSPVIEWNYLTTYSIGSYVMFDGNEYVSLQNSNTSNTPNAASSTFWAQVTGGTLYMSLIDLNINNNPANIPAAWSQSTTYATGNVVAASDGFNYTSLQNSNTNHNPANGANPTWWSQGALTPWTTSFTLGGGNQQWLQIGGAAFPNGVGLSVPNIVYPLGSGPSSQSETKNIFRLPSGYLREAAQDPKAGSVSYLGSPSGLTYNDWEYRGDYIVSLTANPLIFQFIADVQDVQGFDDMFCIGLAERIALTIAEQLTQSQAVVALNVAAYKEFMGEARIVAGVETGADEPAMDDYLICRL